MARSRDSDRGRERGQERGGSQQAGRLLRRVFEMEPLELRALIESYEREESQEENAPEDSLDLDSETPLEDEDEDQDQDEQARIVRERWEAESSEPPRLDLSTIWCLVVTRHEERATCSFEPPPWFQHSRRRHLGPQVSSLAVTLQALAGWLTDQKNEFLVQPSPLTYAKGEEASSAPPVLQQGLLSRIQERISDRSLNESHVSVLLSKTFLLWSFGSLPLKALFSGSFQLAWVVECAIARHPLETWKLEEPPKVRRGRGRGTATVVGPSFQDETLKQLCEQVRVNPREALDEIWKRKEESLG